MQILISIPTANAAERSKLASDLTDRLSVLEGVKVERLRENSEAQDLGTWIQLVLEIPAIISALNVIYSWLSKKKQDSLTIELPDQKIQLRRNNKEDLQKIIELIKIINDNIKL